MAIASLVLHSTGSPGELESSLRAMPGIIDTKQILPDKVAAVLESPAAKILEALQKAEKLPSVWNLELVYVNYEDDLDDGGHMDCPLLDCLNRENRK